MSITVIPQQIIVQVANPALQGPQGIQGPPGSVSLVGYTVATLPAGTKGMNVVLYSAGSVSTTTQSSALHALHVAANTCIVS